MAAKNDSTLISTTLQLGTLVITSIPKSYGQGWPRGNN